MKRTHVLIGVLRAWNVLGKSPDALLHPDWHLVSALNASICRIFRTVAGGDSPFALLHDKPAVELAVRFRIPKPLELALEKHVATFRHRDLKNAVRIGEAEIGQVRHDVERYRIGA